MQMEFKAILFDIDGVLEFQGRAYPGAPELLDFLRRKGIFIRILTNSTLKSRKHCVEKLTQRGFHVRQEEVITASYATAKYLKTLKPKSCWVMPCPLSVNFSSTNLSAGLKRVVKVSRPEPSIASAALTRIFMKTWLSCWG